MRIKHILLWHSTAQHSTAQHSTAQHSTAQHSTQVNNKNKYFRYLLTLFSLALFFSCTSDNVVSTPETKPEETKTYTITFNANGGSIVENQTVTEGGKIVKPTNPTADNLNFAGWYTSSDTSGDAFDFSVTVTENMTLYAKWTKKPVYTVTFDTKGGGDIAVQSIEEDGKATKPINNPTKDGETFAGWMNMETDTAFDFNTLITQNITLYAKWTKNPVYTVVFKESDGTVIETQNIEEGKLLTEPTIGQTKGGYAFGGWSANVDGTGEAFDFDTPVTRDMTLYAKWVYEVSFYARGGAPIPTQKISPQGKVSFVAPTKSGQAFIWWYTSPTFEVSTRYDFDQEVTEHMTLYAKWDNASNYEINTLDKVIIYIKNASGTVEIPYSVDGMIVEAVGYRDFTNIFTNIKNEENTTVTKVILPEGKLRYINGSSFRQCKALTSIVIPDSTLYILGGAFTQSGLTSIDLNNVRSISDYAFSECSSLKSIVIPNSVTSIGGSVFSSCTSLTSITIPSSVSRIGHQAFFYCSSLTSVAISSGVRYIDSYAFSGCSSLTSITIPSSVRSIGTGAFSKCTALISIIIPNSVTSIGNGAFLECSSLTSIDIPNSVTSIGGYVFLDCSRLSNVRVEAETPPTLGANAFERMPSNLSITVPTASLNAYKTNWSAYASKITGY